jgi:hypothetical protein
LIERYRPMHDHYIYESKILISRIEKILGARSSALVISGSDNNHSIKITRNSDHYLIVKTTNKLKSNFYKDIIKINFDGCVETVVSQTSIPSRKSTQIHKRGYLANENVIDKFIVAASAKYAMAEGLVSFVEARA